MSQVEKEKNIKKIIETRLNNKIGAGGSEIFKRLVFAAVLLNAVFIFAAIYFK